MSSLASSSGSRPPSLLARYAESLLFGLAPHDARSLALAAVLLVVTACAAALVPARRAAGVDAAVILRGD